MVFAGAEAFYATATNGARIDRARLEGDTFALELTYNISTDRENMSATVRHQSSWERRSGRRNDLCGLSREEWRR